MTPDTALSWLQTASQLIDPPWGPRINKVAGDLRASFGRGEKDVAPILAMVTELVPIIKKHWPVVGPAINDLLPVIEVIAKDLQS